MPAYLLPLGSIIRSGIRYPPFPGINGSYATPLPKLFGLVPSDTTGSLYRLDLWATRVPARGPHRHHSNVLEQKPQKETQEIHPRLPGNSHPGPNP